MKLFLLTLLSLSCFAQAIVSVTGPSSVKAGSTVVLSVIASNAANISAYQWNLTIPSTFVATATTGATAVTAGKSISCSGSTCIVFGAGNNNLIGNGELASYSVKTPSKVGTVTFSLSGVVGATAQGANAGVTVGPVYVLSLKKK